MTAPRSALERLRLDLADARTIFKKAECTVLADDLALLIALADAVGLDGSVGAVNEAYANLTEPTTEEGD